MFKFLVKFGKIMMIACLIGVAFRVIEVTTKKDYNIAQINQNETIAEEVNIKDTETEMEDISVSNNIEEKQIENVDSKSEEKENSQISNSDNNKTTKNETKDNKVVINDKSKNKNTIAKAQEDIIQIENNTSSNKVEETSERIEQSKEEKQEIKEIEKKEDIKQTVVEEYKRNDTKIAEMEEFINNNKTADMLEYGYEIKKDESIVELTDEFTYTEKRMKNKIKFKSGIIRIYARDYYCNGVLVATQCFII